MVILGTEIQTSYKGSRLSLIFSQNILLPERVCKLEINELNEWNISLDFTDKYDDENKQYTWRYHTFQEEVSKDIKKRRADITFFDWSGTERETTDFIIIQDLHFKVRTYASAEVADKRRLEISIWQKL
jgi:hypothetical protein